MRHYSYDSEHETYARFLESVRRFGAELNRVTVQFSELSDQRCSALLEVLENEWQRIGQNPSAFGKGRQGVRHLDLSSNQLQSFKNSGLINMIRGNHILMSLEVQANGLGLSHEQDIQAFANALGTCALRRLNMTANKLGDAGLSSFFDALPPTGTPLSELYLSVNTVASESGSWRAARSIANFLSTPKKCRHIKYFHLSGNHFGWAGVRAIVHAILGSRRACTLNGTIAANNIPTDMLDAVAPNTNLVAMDLFSTGIDTLMTSTQELLPPELEWETYSAVTPDNWSDVLTEHLCRNQDHARACQLASVQLLAVARTIGCKSREANVPSTKVFPFLRLPTELRVFIMQFIDTDNVLSHEQFINILRWASEPSTIQFIREFGAWPPQHSSVPTENIWGLPPWSWGEAYTWRSVPRNWYSEAMEYDEWHRWQPEKLAFWENTGISTPVY